MDKYLICEGSKKYKRPILKSNDIVVTPLMSEELKKRIEHETDEALIAKFMNMYDRATKDPANALWYTYWDISLKKDEHQSIGYLYFDGPAKLGAVEIAFDCERRYNWDRLIADALRLAAEWIFTLKDIYTINAFMPTEKDGHIRNLERADFVYRSNDHEIQHYSREKAPTSWMGLYMIIGIFIGFGLGFIFSSMAIAMATAFICCSLMGGILDQKDRAHREEITGQSRQGTSYLKRKRK